MRVAAHQSVLLERDGETVGGRPRQAGRRLQLGQRERAVGRTARSTTTALSSTPTPLRLSTMPGIAIPYM